MSSWYLIHTKSGYEEKTYRNLVSKKFEAYLPVCVKEISYGAKVKKNESPLFPNLVFVQTEQQNFAKVRRVRGVQNFLYWLSSPVKIELGDIEVLKDFVESHRDISVEKCMVNVEKPVESLNFPIISREADLVTVKNTITKLYLPCLGFILSVFHEHQPLEFSRLKTIQGSFSAS